MAIQFHCPGCSQPIEVDDVYAGQTAACPYCRRVVNVPSESTLDQTPPIAARAAPGIGSEDAPAPAEPVGSGEAARTGPPPRPTPGELHVGGAFSPRERTARTLGNYALICSGLVVLLFAAVFGYGVSQMASAMAKDAASQPSPERLAEIQTKLAATPWLGAAQIGIAFFALVGLVLGITSLMQSRVSNWRAIASVVVCGLFVLCVCGGTALTIAGGLGAAA